MIMDQLQRPRYPPPADSTSSKSNYPVLSRKSEKTNLAPATDNEYEKLVIYFVFDNPVASGSATKASPVKAVSDSSSSAKEHQRHPTTTVGVDDGTGTMASKETSATSSNNENVSTRPTTDNDVNTNSDNNADDIKPKSTQIPVSPSKKNGKLHVPAVSMVYDSSMTIATLEQVLMNYLVHAHFLPVTSTTQLDLYTEASQSSPTAASIAAAKDQPVHPRAPLSPNMVLSEAHIYPASLGHGHKVFCRVLLPRIKRLKSSLPGGIESAEEGEEEEEVENVVEGPDEEVPVANDSVQLEAMIHEEAEIALWRYFNSVLPALYQFDDSHLRRDRRQHHPTHEVVRKPKYSKWKLFFDECRRHHRYYKCVQDMLVGPPAAPSEDDDEDDMHTVDSTRRVPGVSLEDKEWTWSSFYLSVLQLFTVMNVAFALAILLCSLLPPVYVKSATGSLNEILQAALSLYLLTHLVYMFVFQPGIDSLFYTLSAKVLDTNMLALAQGFATSNTKKATFAYCSYPTSIYHARYRLLRVMRLCEDDRHFGAEGNSRHGGSIHSQSIFSNSVMSYKSSSLGASNMSHSGARQSALFHNVLKISLEHLIARQDRLNQLVLNAINPDFDDMDMDMFGGGGSGSGGNAEAVSAHREAVSAHREAVSAHREAASLHKEAMAERSNSATTPRGGMVIPPPIVITRDPSLLPHHKIAASPASSAGSKAKAAIARSPHSTSQPSQPQPHHATLPSQKSAAHSSIFYSSNRVFPAPGGQSVATQPSIAVTPNSSWWAVCCGRNRDVAGQDPANYPHNMRHLQLRQFIHDTHQSHPNSVQSQLQWRVSSHHFSPPSSRSHTSRNRSRNHSRSSPNLSRSRVPSSLGADSNKSKSIASRGDGSVDSNKHVGDGNMSTPEARRERTTRGSGADTVIVDREEGAADATSPANRSVVAAVLSSFANAAAPQGHSSVTTTSVDDDIVQLDLLEQGLKIANNNPHGAKRSADAAAAAGSDNGEDYDRKYSLDQLEAAFGDIEQLCIAFTQKTLDFDRPFFNLSYMVVMQGQNLLQKLSECQRAINFQQASKANTAPSKVKEEEQLAVLTTMWRQYSSAWNLNADNSLFLPIPKYSHHSAHAGCVALCGAKKGTTAAPHRKKAVHPVFAAWSWMLNAIHFCCAYLWYLVTYYIPHWIAYRVCSVHHRRLNAFRFQSTGSAPNKVLNMEDVLSALLMPPTHGSNGNGVELPQDFDDFVFILCQSSVSFSSFCIAVLYKLCPLTTWALAQAHASVVWLFQRSQAWLLFCLHCGTVPFNSGSAKQREAYDPFLIPNTSLLALMEKQRQSLFFASDANVGIEILQQYMQDSLGGLFTLPAAVLHLKTQWEYTSLPLVPNWRYASALLAVLVLNVAAALLTLTYMVLPLIFSRSEVESGNTGTSDALSSYAALFRLLEIVLAVFLTILVIESFFLETFSVYYQHILVPRSVCQDVHECLQRIVPETFHNFAKFMLQARDAANKGAPPAASATATATTPRAVVPTSAMLQKYSLTKEDKIKAESTFFSMTDYLYVSVHLAKSFPVLLESLLVLAPSQFLPTTALQRLWLDHPARSAGTEEDAKPHTIGAVLREHWLYLFVAMPTTLHMLAVRVSTLLLLVLPVYAVLYFVLYLSKGHV